jgi:hypothetical protein
MAVPKVNICDHKNVWITGIWAYQQLYIFLIAIFPEPRTIFGIESVIITSIESQLIEMSEFSNLGRFLKYHIELYIILSTSLYLYIHIHM